MGTGDVATADATALAKVRGGEGWVWDATCAQLAGAASLEPWEGLPCVSQPVSAFPSPFYLQDGSVAVSKQNAIAGEVPDLGIVVLDAIKAQAERN